MSLSSSPQGKPARLHFEQSDFSVLEPGDFVLCAVTAAPIPLALLKYWNAERQEAYCSSQAAFERSLDFERPNRP